MIRVVFSSDRSGTYDVWEVTVEDLRVRRLIEALGHPRVRLALVGHLVEGRGDAAGHRVLVLGRALERPLEEVRQTLGVVPIEHYEGLRSEGAPALA